MAEVVAINISMEKGKIKKPISEGKFTANHGLEDDAHAGDWHRQVSLLAQESIDKMVNDKIKLNPGIFAENITTIGINLHEIPIGTLLEIGDTIHEVTQIGKECHKGCEIRNIVGDCVMPREGIFTKILKGGTIKPGDCIKVRKE